MFDMKGEAMTEDERKLLESMLMPKHILDADPQKVTATEVEIMQREMGLIRRPRKHRTVSEFMAARYKQLGYSLSPTHPTPAKG